MKAQLTLTREEALGLLQVEDEGQTSTELGEAVAEAERTNYLCLVDEAEVTVTVTD